MYYLDPVKNFCQVEVQGGYAESASAVSLFPGQGVKLPDPATDGEYNLVWWNVTDNPNPADDIKREIVRVTAKTGDNLTIVRAQEETTATSKNSSGKRYFMALVLTAKTIQDIDAKLQELHGGNRVLMEVAGGAKNGTNTVFTTSQEYKNLEVYVNGVRQRKTDFTETGLQQFTLLEAPVPGDDVDVCYNL